MTEKLKTYLIGEVKKQIPELTKKVKKIDNIQSKKIGLPIYIDGVVDIIYWDVKMQKFTEVEFIYAIDDGGIVSQPFLTANIVLCDNVEYIRVAL